ncbi:C-glycoside deglycosidase beta subunit domain-containing protein [Enterococcus sp. LJL99]
MFAMRMKFNNEIIKKKSFRAIYINGKNNGFSFDTQLAYYRGHYLSDIDVIEVYVDGEKIAEEAVTFELNEKEMPLYKLKYAVTEFWSQVNKATIHVLYPNGLSGEHEIELKLVLRIPYMQIGPDHQFMPLDSGEKVMVRMEAGE